MMERVAVFVDGFNMYHGLKKLSKTHGKVCKWVDLKALTQKFIDLESQKPVDLFYFSALCEWDKDKREKHQRYIERLKALEAKVVLGDYNRVQRTFSSSNPVEKMLVLITMTVLLSYQEMPISYQLLNL